MIAPSMTKGSARAFARDAAGVAAVEFAIILPVAMALMALVVYGGQLYRVQRKVSLAAATVADLAAQGGNNTWATISTPEINQILAYPELILNPFDPTETAEVVVSQLNVTVVSGVATAKVDRYWANQNAINANATPTCGQQMSIDTNVDSALTASGNSGPYFVILGTVLLPFQPYDLFGTVAPVIMHDSNMMIPRTTENGVQGPSATVCP